VLLTPALLSRSNHFCYKRSLYTRFVGLHSCGFLHTQSRHVV